MELNGELWKERFASWMRLRNWSEQTVSTYLTGLELFFVYLRSQAVESLSVLSRDLVEGYRAALYARRFRGKPLSASTQAIRLGAVKAFLRYLVRENYLLVDVAASVDLPKTPRLLPRVLSEDEVLRLIEAPDLSSLTGIRDRAMLETLYASGMRNGEMGALEVADLDWERQALWIRLGKGKKSRLVPLGEEALIWLEEYLARVRPRLLLKPEEQRLFLSRKGNPLKRDAIRLVVNHWAASVGLKDVRPHTLRHTCATHMLRRGAGIRHLQTMLGHSSPLTTEHYTQVDLTDLHKVLKRCHPREKAFGR